VVLTNQKKMTFLKYLKMQYIFEGLSLDAQRLLFDAPETLKDDLFVGLLRARQEKIPEEILLQRIWQLQTFFEQPLWNERHLRALRGDLRFEVREHSRPIRKGKKKKRVRSPSAVGSKRPSLVKPEPERYEWSSFVKLNVFEYLTVGAFTGKSLVIRLPDEAPK